MNIVIRETITEPVPVPVAIPEPELYYPPAEWFEHRHRIVAEQEAEAAEERRERMAEWCSAALLVVVFATAMVGAWFLGGATW